MFTGNDPEVVHEQHKDRLRQIEKEQLIDQLTFGQSDSLWQSVKGWLFGKR